jgi:hypothetical protein
MNYQILNIQIALFSPGIDLSDKLTFAQQVKQKTGVLFDGETVVLPIPEDAPAEIPRIVLQSKSNQTSLNISPNKIDFFIKPGINDSFTSASIESNKIYSSLLETLFKVSSLNITRVGHVFNIEASVENSIDFISDRYLSKINTGKNLQDINFGILKKDTIDKKLSNIWFRVNPSKNPDMEVDDRRMSVVLDVNTSSKEPQKFNVESTIQYLEQSAKYLDKYFSELFE